MRSYSYGFCITVLVLLTAAVFIIHVGTGFTYFSYDQLIRILLGGGTPEERLTVFDFRLVRSILALLVGMGLSLSGTIFQTVSKNGLASPSLLGVNAGAGFAVLLLIYRQSATEALPLWALPVAAIAGASLTALIIYRLSYRKGRKTSMYTLILNGVSLAAGIHALEIVLIVRLDSTKFHQVNAWIIGSIFGNSWGHVAVLLPVVAGLGLFLWFHHRDLDILSLSDETAIGLGLDLNRSRFLYLMTAVVLAACCVAVGGSIAFIGLICPHIARRLVGVRHSRVLPAAALLGALLLCTADWVSRVIIAPDEMLVGTIVALIGAPYFMYLFLKKPV